MKPTYFFRAVFLSALIPALFAPFSFAALSLQDFSCNGGQSNVELGVAFNCNAVILNDDPNNDASLSSVSLSSLNGWTSQSSYDGSFSGNSVTRGGTKGVSFSNIIPTAPGASNKFTDVVINGAPSASAIITDSALNVVSINSLTLTVPASANASTEFDVQASTVLGGRADLNSTVSLSGGCSLKAGQSATVSLGQVSDSTQTASWRVLQGAGACSISVTSTALAFPVLLSSSKSGSTASNVAASSSSGGSSGSSATATPAATPAPTIVPVATTPAPTISSTPTPSPSPSPTPRPNLTARPSPAPALQTPAPTPARFERKEQPGLDLSQFLLVAGGLLALAGLYLLLKKKSAI